MKEIVDILKQYSKESGTIIRSTSDLSPLEVWLIQQLKNCNLQSVRLSLPTTKELRDARELYELQVKSNSMMNKPISGHWQEGVEWILSRIIEGNEA